MDNRHQTIAIIVTNATTAATIATTSDYRDDRRDHRDYRKDVRQAYRQDQRNYRRWARGQYIPRDYMASRYYINDYRNYRLAPPPRGYAWVRPYQNDDTYYMVQIASGLIAQIFNNR